VATQLAEAIQAETLTGLRVQIWENDIAWASYSLPLR
jgi:hypothetical protein